MIHAISIKIIALILLLCAFAGVLTYINMGYLSQNVAESQKKLNIVRSESSELRTQVEKLKTDYAAFEKERDKFEQITRLGFFNAQDRVEAREKFGAIERLSKIMFARYEIKAASIVSSEKDLQTNVLGEIIAEQSVADYVVIESPVSVSLSAIDDIDIYRFIYYMNYGFPGHVTINQISIQKTEKLTADIIKQIGLGNPQELVTGTIDLTWRTMIQKSVADSLSDLKVLSSGAAQ
jgi:hypothetical protein